MCLQIVHVRIRVNIVTHLSFPFRGEPCISDDEDMKEVDLPDIEADSGCAKPDLPENAFIWVSILIFTFGLEFKKLN